MTMATSSSECRGPLIELLRYTAAVVGTTGKTLSDHVFRDPNGNTLCISCLPEHLQESAYRYTESLDMLAAGPEREAGDGTPLRSAICSLAPASSERHPRFHMHFTPTSGSGSLRTLSD